MSFVTGEIKSSGQDHSPPRFDSPAHSELHRLAAKAEDADRRAWQARAERRPDAEALARLAVDAHADVVEKQWSLGSAWLLGFRCALDMNEEAAADLVRRAIGPTLDALRSDIAEVASAVADLERGRQ